MNFISKTFLLCLMVLMAFSTSIWGSGKDIIEVRVSDYAPQYYLNKTGDWTGLDVELARAVIQEAGFKPVFVELPWARALEELKFGRVQIMMNLSKTDKRSQFLHWIGPERFSQLALVVKKGNEFLPVKKIDDLLIVAKKQGINFGIQTEYHYGNEFMEKLKDKSFSDYFEPIPTDLINPRKTKKGRILGFFEDKVSMVYKIKNNPAYNELALHSFILHKEPVYFGISKMGVSNEVLEKLGKAFERLNQNGKLDTIRNTEW
jgi:polar amino acid transport system substrate-binding protein